MANVPSIAQSSLYNSSILTISLVTTIPLGTLNAEFQRIAKRDKKAFLSDQCKEIEESNRLGKTRDLFKKIRDTQGTFHVSISWQVDGETMEPVTDFTILGSKITADGDCSHEIKRHLLLGKKL